MIDERIVDRPCPLCGVMRQVREFVNYPRLVTPSRSETERSAVTPAEWERETKKSPDGTRKY